MLPICYKSATRMLRECYKCQASLSDRFRIFQATLPIETEKDKYSEERGEGGAGEGNRTPLTSLGSWSITTMLRPHPKVRTI